MHHTNNHLRAFFTLILLTSSAVIATVLIAQYGFNLYPCELCLYQRIPFVLLIMVSGVGLVMGTRHPARQLYLCLGCGLLLLVSTGLGAYHAGVEKNLFKGPTACTSQPSERPLSVEEMKAQIMGAPLVACNEPAWQWHGITMAGMNAAFSLVMALYALIQFGRFRKHAR